jgi:uncharacterized membrane protein YraQ (UPF0718 family)
MNFIGEVLLEAWNLLLDSSPYILLGLLISGLIKTFIGPQMVARHLGTNRFASVFKAALFGIPIPL